jgi:iron complex outermembrane receptor protein
MTTTRAPHSPAAKRRTQRLARALAGAAASVLSTVGVALAEDSASEDVWAGIEEMVVIGSSATALLQEVSVSVASFDSADLEAIGAQSIADVAQFTPNLEIRTVFAASNPTLFIRGVGLRDFNANSASSVAVYNDDVYMNSPAAQLAQLFDTERVDILRGPQGTLFGRNASAGAIRIVSRRPTGGFGGFTRFTYGRYDQIEVEGAIEAPIVPGKLSIRLAGRRNLRDGITENRCGDSEFWDDPGENARTSFKQRVHNSCFNDDTTSTVGRGQGWVPGEPTGVDEDVNDKDNWAARAILHFEPTVDQDWFLNVHGGQNRGDSRQFQVIGVVDLAGGFDLGRPTRPIYRDPDTETPNTTFPPIPPIFGAETPEAGDAFAGDYNTVGKEELDLLGGNLRGEIQWGDLTFTTITGIEWNQRNVETNLDGGPRISLEPELDNHSYQFTQELTATYDTGGEYTLEAGTTFLFEHLEVENRIDLDPNRFTLQDYEQDTYYGALFAYGSWAPSAAHRRHERQHRGPRIGDRELHRRRLHGRGQAQLQAHRGHPLLREIQPRLEEPAYQRRRRQPGSDRIDGAESRRPDRSRRGRRTRIRCEGRALPVEGPLEQCRLLLRLPEHPGLSAAQLRWGRPRQRADQRE